jgi:hypothetical protein
MDLRKIGWENVDWKHLDQDRDQWWAVVNTVMNLRVRVSCNSWATNKFLRILYHGVGIK